MLKSTDPKKYQGGLMGRCLKATREKGQVIYKVKTIRYTPDFSTGNLKARWTWTDIQSSKIRCQLRLQYLEKLSTTVD